MMGLRMLYKHYCNSKNAFAICFISASAKNTCRAGLIYYGIILNFNTMGEMLQFNTEWRNTGFFVSITMYFSSDACFVSFISFAGLIGKWILIVFPLRCSYIFTSTLLASDSKYSQYSSKELKLSEEEIRNISKGK